MRRPLTGWVRRSQRKYVEPRIRISVRSQKRTIKITKSRAVLRPSTSSSKKTANKTTKTPTRFSSRLEKKSADEIAKKAEKAAEKVAEKLENSTLVFNLVSQKQGNPYTAVFRRDPMDRLNPAKGATQIVINKRSDLPLLRHLGREPRGFSIIFDGGGNREGDNEVESIRSRTNSELAIFGHEYESIDQLNEALASLASGSDGDVTDDMEVELDEMVSDDDETPTAGEGSTLAVM